MVIQKFHSSAWYPYANNAAPMTKLMATTTPDPAIAPMAPFLTKGFSSSPLLLPLVPSEASEPEPVEPPVAVGMVEMVDLETVLIGVRLVLDGEGGVLPSARDRGSRPSEAQPFENSEGIVNRCETVCGGSILTVKDGLTLSVHSD